MLIKDPTSANTSSATLTAQLCVSGLLQRTATNSYHLLNLLQLDKDINRTLKSRILQALHFICAPKCLNLEGLSDIIFQLEQLSEPDLLKWVDEQEGIRQTVRHLYLSKNVSALGEFIHRNYISMFCLDSDAKYENILHHSVNDDFVQCTALLTGQYIEDQSDCINQRNHLGDSPLHVAAKMLKTAHLKLLIRSPKADLLTLNRDDRNILHLLLISLQKRWSTQRSKSISDRKMYSRSPPPTEIISLLSEILQRIFLVSGTACFALTRRDRYQLSALDYALNLNYISIFGILSSEIRGQKDIIADADAQWSQMLSHAILMNSSETVAAVAAEYVRYYEQKTSMNILAGNSIDQHSGTTMISSIPESNVISALESKGFKILPPVDFLIEAIRRGKLKALHTLLSIPLFRQNINTTSSSGYTPLKAAVRNFKNIPHVEGSLDSTTLFHIDILRTLINHGSDISRSLESAQQSAPNYKNEQEIDQIKIKEGMKNGSRNGAIASKAIPIGVGNNKNMERQIMGKNKYEYPDNIFAYAALCGAIEAIRLLLYSYPAALCIICNTHSQLIPHTQYVRDTKSYVQNSYLTSVISSESFQDNMGRWGCNDTSRERNLRNDDGRRGERVTQVAGTGTGSGGFYFGSTRYFSNPLTHAISAGNVLCLQYLLTTPFSQLINLISCSSQHTGTITSHLSALESHNSESTPLSVAVQTCNEEMVEILMRSNACPTIKLKAAAGNVGVGLLLLFRYDDKKL